MSALTSTFESLVLRDLVVAVDRCDQEIGATLATMLAERGADVRLRGEDKDELRDLQRSIIENWGRASLAVEREREAAALVAIVAAGDELRAPARSDDEADAPRRILIVTGAARDERNPTARAGDHRMHAILVPTGSSSATDFGSLVALVTFLLSPAGKNIPAQCFRLQERSPEVPGNPLHPPMPEHVPIG